MQKCFKQCPRFTDKNNASSFDTSDQQYLYHVMIDTEQIRKVVAEFLPYSIVPFLITVVIGRFTSIKAAVTILTALLLIMIAGISIVAVELPSQPGELYDFWFLIMGLSGFVAFPIFVSSTYGFLIGQWLQRRHVNKS